MAGRVRLGRHEVLEISRVGSGRVGSVMSFSNITG